MPSRYRSIHRWDDLIQSEFHEIAASPLGDFFAAAASQGAVFVFETVRASAIHIIQLRLNEQPICCVWNLRTSADKETSELELILGTSHGLVASVCLNAKKELGCIQWIEEVFPDAVVRLAVCTEPTGMTLLAVAFGKQVEIWCRIHGQNIWSKCKGTSSDNPGDIVDNVCFVAPTRLIISYLIGGLCVWDTRTNTLRPVEDYNPPSLTIGGHQIPTPSPLKTVQTDIWLDRALVVRTTRQYLLAYRLFAGAQDSVVSLVHSAPLISYCDVRIGDIDETTVVLQPDSPTRLRVCKINNLSLRLDAPPEDLLDHGGRVVGNAAIFSHHETGCSFVVTTSKDTASHSPWIRVELWKRANSDIASRVQTLSDSNPKVFILPVRLQEAIDERAKESSNAWLRMWLPSVMHMRIALGFFFAWIVWLKGVTPVKPTDLIQRTPKQMVADVVWALIGGSYQAVMYAVDDSMYAAQVQVQAMADGIRHLYRLVIIWAHGG